MVAYRKSLLVLLAFLFMASSVVAPATPTITYPVEGGTIFSNESLAFSVAATSFRPNVTCNLSVNGIYKETWQYNNLANESLAANETYPIGGDFSFPTDDGVNQTWNVTCGYEEAGVPGTHPTSSVVTAQTWGVVPPLNVTIALGSPADNTTLPGGLINFTADLTQTEGYNTSFSCVFYLNGSNAGVVTAYPNATVSAVANLTVFAGQYVEWEWDCDENTYYNTTIYSEIYHVNVSFPPPVLNAVTLGVSGDNQTFTLAANATSASLLTYIYTVFRDNVPLFNGTSASFVGGLNVTIFSFSQQGNGTYNATVVANGGSLNSTAMDSNGVVITLLPGDTTPPQISYGVLTLANGSQVLVGSAVDIHVIAVDAHLANVSVYLFDVANNSIFNATTTDPVLHVTPNISVAGVYHFYAIAYDNSSNSNQTAVWQFTAIRPPGETVGSVTMGTPLSVPLATGQVVVDDPLHIVNVEENGTLDVRVKYLDAAGDPQNATSAAADIAYANGTVVRQAVVQELALGVYGVQSDVSGLPKGDYNVTMHLDGNEYGGITARVTAFTPALGILYDKGEFSAGRAVVAGGAAAVSLFLVILGIGAVFP